MQKPINQALNSLVQLLTLGVGIAIGVLIAPRFDRHVEAQGSTSTSPESASTPNVIPLQNFMSSPALVSNVLLAHEFEADHAVVNGYDLLLLDENIVNYLASLPIGNRGELSTLAERSKATTRYTLPQRQSVSPRPGAQPNGANQSPK